MGAAAILALGSGIYVLVPLAVQAARTAVDRQPPTVSLAFEVDGVVQEGSFVSVRPGSRVVVRATTHDDVDPSPTLSLRLVSDVGIAPGGAHGLPDRPILQDEVLPLLGEGSYHVLVDASDSRGNSFTTVAVVEVSTVPVVDEGLALVTQWHQTIGDDGGVSVEGSLIFWAPGQPSLLSPNAVSVQLLDWLGVPLVDLTSRPAMLNPQRIESDPRGFAVLRLQAQFEGPFRNPPAKLMLHVMPGAPLEPGVRSRIIIDDLSPFPNAEQALARVIERRRSGASPRGLNGSRPSKDSDP